MKMFIALLFSLVANLSAEILWKKNYKSGDQKFTFSREKENDVTTWKLTQDSDGSICYKYSIKNEKLGKSNMVFRTVNKVFKEKNKLIIWFSEYYESKLVYCEKNRDGTWREKRILRIEGLYDTGNYGDKETVSSEFKSFTEIETKTRDGSVTTFKIRQNEDKSWSVFKNGEPYDKKHYCNQEVKTN